MRIILSLGAVLLGLALAWVTVSTRQFDLFTLGIAAVLVAGGIKLWRRHQIRDETRDVRDGRRES
jgi:hypothetical protein